jgi:hypothetical protein
MSIIERSKNDGEGSWVDEETAGSRFKDVRLGQRFQKLLKNMSGAVGQSIPFACEDWANTKAAYRFFANDRVSEEEILSGHFEATSHRTKSVKGPLLVLHDTTEFSYERDQPEEIGFLNNIKSGLKYGGRARYIRTCGILMHSSVAITPEGLPLGISAVKFWTRDQFKGTAALKRKINPTRVPIEAKESIRWLENMKQSTQLLGVPEQCIHIGDREADIYELFCTAHELGTHFVIRTCVNRLAEDGKTTVADEMKAIAVKGRHAVTVRDKKGNLSDARLEIRYHQLLVRPPVGKEKKYPPLTLTVIHAQEAGTPKDRKKIDWKLITDLPVRSSKDAIQKLQWYALRWKIEVFHKILKSGCKAEESKLRTADRLTNLISIFCILSWRIFWMTMVNRLTINAKPTLALTDQEITLIDHLMRARHGPSPKRTDLAYYLNAIARLGGYLARANDPPPGNMVMWRGLSRLTDIELGAIIGAKLVGN